MVVYLFCSWLAGYGGGGGGGGCGRRFDINKEMVGKTPTTGCCQDTLAITINVHVIVLYLLYMGKKGLDI
jgi:hypothetical protein